MSCKCPQYSQSLADLECLACLSQWEDCPLYFATHSQYEDLAGMGLVAGAIHNAWPYQQIRPACCSGREHEQAHTLRAFRPPEISACCRHKSSKIQYLLQAEAIPTCSRQLLTVRNGCADGRLDGRRLRSMSRT